MSANFTSATLTGAYLHGSSFVNAVILKAKARETDFTTCNFTGANLQRADFSVCSVRNANFTDANIRRINRGGWDSHGATFLRAKGVALKPAFPPCHLYGITGPNKEGKYSYRVLVPQDNGEKEMVLVGFTFRDAKRHAVDAQPTAGEGWALAQTEMPGEPMFYNDHVDGDTYTLAT